MKKLKPWITSRELAELLQMSIRRARDQVSHRPDFPAALRIDGGGHPKWNRAEVLRWMRKERTKNPGRTPGAAKKATA